MLGSKLIFFAPLGAGVNEENQITNFKIPESKINLVLRNKNKI